MASYLKLVLFPDITSFLSFSDYKEYHTDVTVRFVLSMTEEKLAEAEAAGLHKKFKLETSINTSNMVSSIVSCGVHVLLTNF